MMKATLRTGKLTPRTTSRLSILNPFRRERHEMTRAGLRNLSREWSGRLSDLLREREAARPANDTVVRDHEYAHRRVTLHDEETQRIYIAEYAPEISNLRHQFVRRGIRSGPLDACYTSPENEADLRTISTALLEMSARLKK